MELALVERNGSKMAAKIKAPLILKKDGQQDRLLGYEFETVEGHKLYCQPPIEVVDEETYRSHAKEELDAVKQFRRKEGFTTIAHYRGTGYTGAAQDGHTR